MIILIFKTTLFCPFDVAKVSTELTTLVGINNWSVDIGDEDKVLRIKAQRNVSKEVKHLLIQFGYSCEVLK
jgi:hypothetical protein